MPELRKLIHLTKSVAAVTLPRKYLEALDVKFDSYLEVSLVDQKTIAVRKHSPPQKQ